MRNIRCVTWRPLIEFHRKGHLYWLSNLKENRVKLALRRADKSSSANYWRLGGRQLWIGIRSAWETAGVLLTRRNVLLNSLFVLCQPLCALWPIINQLQAFKVTLTSIQSALDEQQQRQRKWKCAHAWAHVTPLNAVYFKQTCAACFSEGRLIF